MNDTKYLSIYLNDHLGGSKFGISLARRIAKSSEGTTGSVFDQVADEIEEDRKTLRKIMVELGIRKGGVKRALAAVGEKLSRFKPNGKLVGRSPLTPVIEMETLSIGVEGKRLLWHSLDTASVRVDGVDYGELIKRAESQRERIETERRKAAQAAFRLSGSSETTSREPAAAGR
jgi:hypothetical protein